MMKTYKLIKKYPGCPDLGFISKPHDNIEKSNNNHYWRESWFNPQDFPEFWEEVIEKEYEILEFSDGFNTFFKKQDENFTINLQYSYTEKELLEGAKKTVFISKIKRLSDQEVFTVGDVVSSLGGKDKITGFRIISNNEDKWSNGLHFLFNEGHAQMDKQIKTKNHLFTTEDNVPIYERNEYWIVCRNNHIQKEPPAKKDWKQKDWEYKYFSTEKAAKDFVALNKIDISKNELTDILKNYITIGCIEEILERIHCAIAAKYIL